MLGWQLAGRVRGSDWWAVCCRGCCRGNVRTCGWDPGPGRSLPCSNRFPATELRPHHHQLLGGGARPGCRKIGGNCGYIKKRNVEWTFVINMKFLRKMNLWCRYFVSHPNDRRKGSPAHARSTFFNQGWLRKYELCTNSLRNGRFGQPRPFIIWIRYYQHLSLLKSWFIALYIIKYLAP